MPMEKKGLVTVPDERTALLKRVSQFKTPTPYQRVMRAAKRGVGLRLTAKEVECLAAEPVIAVHARRQDEIDFETLCDAAEKLHAQRADEADFAAEGPSMLATNPG